MSRENKTGPSNDTCLKTEGSDARLLSMHRGEMCNGSNH